MSIDANALVFIVIGHDSLSLVSAVVLILVGACPRLARSLPVTWSRP